MAEIPAPRSSGLEDIPRYTFPEAERYLRIPSGTLSSWVRGRHYQISDGERRFWSKLIARPDPANPRLSFSNLLEAYVIKALRRTYRVPIPTIRRSLDEAAMNYGIPNLLRSDALRVNVRNLFLEDVNGRLVKLGKGLQGQQGIPEILNSFLKRIEWATDSTTGFPISLAPVTRDDPDPDKSPQVVLIRPEIALGKPFVKSRAIRTAAISERFLLGESVAEIADDYDIDPAEVEEAIRYERPAQAAA